MQTTHAVTPELESRLQDHIDGIGLLSPTITANRSQELDEQGTNLWNVASRLKGVFASGPLCTGMY